MKNDPPLFFSPDKTPLERILAGHASARVTTDEEENETIEYDVEIEPWWEEILTPIRVRGSLS